MTNSELPLVSQDYFDEICAENYELFSEDSYEAAVEETVTQLKGKSLRHISLTYPDSEKGLAVRRDMSKMLSTLKSVKCGNDLEASLNSLDATLRSACSAQSEPYLLHHIFVVNDGFDALGHAFDCHVGDDHIAGRILATLDGFPIDVDKQFRSAFQTAIPSLILSSWTSSFRASQSAPPHLQVLLSIAYKSIRRCEANKRLWMEQKEDPWCDILVEHLRTQTASLGPDADFSASSACTVCRIITCLCTFDDFTEDSSDQQLYVQTLFRAGALAALETCLGKTTHSAIVDALRALAIQDEVVQTMGSVIDKAKECFSDNCNRGTDDDELLTALLGLFRNVSANDDFKKKLGSDSTLLSSLLTTMQRHSNNVQLQEHAIAWVAALALRHPDNADRLGSSSDMISAIVCAMKRFCDRSSLQRQAALAFRNIASRLSDDQVRSVLRSEVQEVLNTVAAKHMKCQDEVYAALRDLGLDVTSLHVKRIGDSVEIRKGPLMFGQSLESNFRAEYDD